jgi:hypothetical protein
LLLAGGVLAGCGGSAGGSPGAGEIAGLTQPAGATARVAAKHRSVRTPAKSPAANPGSGRRRLKAKGIAPRKTSRAIVARVDASSDATLAAAGQATVSAGAPSDAEIRKEIEEAANAGIALPTGNTSAAFVASAEAISITDDQALAVGASIPVAAWNPLRRPIANWIVPVLQWAYENGWTGTVTSGYRTFAEQAELNAAGDFSAPAGTSNHESTTYPGGAVDVTNSSQLLGILPGYPGPEKLHGGVLGPIDPEHFSATGD